MAEIQAEIQAGIYGRVSVENQEGDEASIESQIAIGKEWIHNLANAKLAGIYTDVGATGRNFRRKGFQKLLKDIEQKKVNCVVVKDFSRFGRNYLEIGNYLEKIFPAMGVRFVAVTDGYDSWENQDYGERMAGELKRIIDEMYAGDISERVKAGKKMKILQGGYAGGPPPYGWQAAYRDNRRVLIADEKAQEIIGRICRAYEENDGISQIRRMLYQERVCSPSEYRKRGRIHWEEGEGGRQWPDASILAVIKRNGEKEAVYNVIDKGAGLEKAVSQGKKAKRNKFPPLLCGECGHKLKRYPSGTRNFYGCPRIVRIDEERCSGPYTAEPIVKAILRSLWEREILFADPEKLRGEADIWKEGLSGINRQKKRLEGQLARRRLKQGQLYRRYKKKEIAWKEFQNLMEREEEGKKRLETDLKKAEAEKEQAERKRKDIESLIGRLEMGEWTAEMEEAAAFFISKVFFYKDKRAKILLSYRDFWMDGERIYGGG